MAVGVEVRVPFLDQELLSNCFLWPQKVVYKNGERKAFFKQALSGILPKSILTKRKKGFGFPLNAWSGRICAFAKPLLNDGLLIGHGYACQIGIQKRTLWIGMASNTCGCCLQLNYGSESL